MSERKPRGSLRCPLCGKYCSGAWTTEWIAEGESLYYEIGAKCPKDGEWEDRIYGNKESY